MTSANILICDLLGLRFDELKKPDFSEIKSYIDSKGGVFHECGIDTAPSLEAGKLHFFYQPDIGSPENILNATADGQYDAIIAAASYIPEGAKLRLGGVRIGAGTGNMASSSWGGSSGNGGEAPLMNTPGINSRATAQMVFKAILRVRPDLPVAKLHHLVATGNFDTRRELRNYPTEKLEGKKLVIAGFGHIGHELASLGKAFAMHVVVFAREHHKESIEAEGFQYAKTVELAAKDADVFSVHLGRGPFNQQTGRFANDQLIGNSVLSKFKHGSVLINYDRGELVDVEALRMAMATGKVAHAAIDADIFKDVETGALSGPMVPYLSLVPDFSDRLELLPHAAADTDHSSRVIGAKQAIDQVFNSIKFKKVTNLIGSLPLGYSI